MSEIKIDNSVRYSRKGSMINPRIPVSNSAYKFTIAWLLRRLPQSFYGIGLEISVKCCLYNVEYQTLFVGPLGYNLQNALLY